MMELELCKKDREMIERVLSLAEYRNKVVGEVVVSCTEAARLLGVTPKTISSMIKDGRLKKVKIEDSTGIRLSEIEEKRREA